MTFYYSVAITYFMVEDYEKARKWNNMVINMEVKKVRKKVQAAAKFFNIIIHHELKHYLIIETIANNLVNYLKRVNRYGTAENKIISALLKSSKVPSDRDRKKIFKTLASQIDNLEMKNKEIATIQNWFKKKEFKV